MILLILGYCLIGIIVASFAVVAEQVDLDDPDDLVFFLSYNLYMLATCLTMLYT